MANAAAVCLLLVSFFCFTNVSFARQSPKECSKGPEYWCQNLKKAADCGAVGHCIGSVWEKQESTTSKNVVSDKFVRLFKQLKDIKDLINEEYLGIRVRTACKDIKYPSIAGTCKQNTGKLEKYLMHVLTSETTPETMCLVVGMCNNPKLDSALKKKKTTEPKFPGKLIGGERCTWGPSYWCSNISTSHDCNAIHHCVQKVWPKMTVPEDNDTICSICKDMVQQARDQLTSNQTQEDLKSVFEGSCKLIPIKLVAKECIKLADDFVPELVETLSSQMNPSIVCSVAGLCNNARIDRLLEDYNKQVELRAGCTNCHKTVTVVRKKFDATSYEDFLVGLLKACGNLGSYSDSCSMLVFKYYENILAALKKDLSPQSVCHLNGECSFMFHSHKMYTFPNEDALTATDDVPCELCEQMVKHLRDVLIANTTELEFYKVMKGLCKQTGGFKTECLHLIDEYYSKIYDYLVHQLNATEVCSMIGICGKVGDVPIAPLLPREIVVKAITPSSKLIDTDEAYSYKIDKVKQTNVQVMPSENVPPLPIERMFVSMPENKAVCSFCQYFLHYLQVELSDVKTEDAIKDAVEKACEKLPDSVNGQCKQFVSQYGPAVIALLVQEIDPASVCPALKLCPQIEEIRHVTINSEKSNCPLCLFAIEQLETMLESNRTQANIRNALDKLCNHLSQKLKTECIDFVDTYSSQIVNMLINNTKAQEICVYLGLCKDTVADPLMLTHSHVDKYHEKPHLRGDRNNFRKQSLLPKHMLEKGEVDIETNEIPDNTVNGRPVKSKLTADTVCVVCEFVMKEIDDQIKDKHNDDEIKKAVHGVCKHMPKSVRSQCDQFVEKYADFIISLLAQELDPSQVCEELKLCKPSAETIVAVREDILDCAVCETVVAAVKKVLSNDKVDRNIVHIVEKSCGLLPAKYSTRCHTLMEIYGDSIIHLIEEIGTKGVCAKIGLCSDHSGAYVHMNMEQTGVVY